MQARQVFSPALVLYLPGCEPVTLDDVPGLARFVGWSFIHMRQVAMSLSRGDDGGRGVKGGKNDEVGSFRRLLELPLLPLAKRLPMEQTAWGHRGVGTIVEWGDPPFSLHHDIETSPSGLSVRIHMHF